MRTLSEIQGKEVLKNFFQIQDKNGKSQYHTHDYSCQWVQNAMGIFFVQLLNISNVQKNISG